MSYDGWSSWAVKNFVLTYEEEILTDLEDDIKSEYVTLDELHEWTYDKVDEIIEGIIDAIYTETPNSFAQDCMNDEINRVSSAISEIAGYFEDLISGYCSDSDDEESGE